MSSISSLDLGESNSPMPGGPSVHSADSNNLAHKLAVRIACHMVRDRRPEARAFLEVETCITVTGAIPSEERAIEIRSDDEIYKFELHLSRNYHWEQTLISNWVSMPRGLACSSWWRLDPEILVVKESLAWGIAASGRESTCSSAYHAGVQCWSNCSIARREQWENKVFVSGLYSRISTIRLQTSLGNYCIHIRK